MNIERSVTSKIKLALKNAGLSGKVAYTENQLRPVLLNFLTSLEEIASKACKPFNSFGLLCALQHYLPIHIIEPRAGFEADAQILFNNAATLAFRFSSSTDDAKAKLTRADYVRISEMNDLSWLEDYSEVVLQIYYIADVIDLTIKILRWLGKGATATVDLTAKNASTIVKMQTPAELQQKMRQYDERVIRNQSILIKQAIPLGAVKPTSPLKCVVVNLNLSEFRNGNLNPPPVPVIFGMDAIYTFTSFHSDEVIQVFNKRVHVEDLFVFMAALFKPLVEDFLNNVRFAGQGYSFTEEQHLIDYVANWAPAIYAECFSQGVFADGTPCVLESFSQAYWEEVVPEMLRFISHDFVSRDTIDPLLLHPVRFAYRCDDGTIFLHLGSLIHFFMYFLDQFQSTGQFGEIKGRALEVLLSDIIESVKGFKRIWEPGHRLKLPVAGKVGTDVDVFVQRNELALLISCKSYSVNREYELGNGQTCWDRSGAAKSWLRFAHQTAKVVAEHHKELKLPKEIKGILPLVCTGWHEYLFEPSEDYFLVDGTPRLATLREIEQFCRNLGARKVRKLFSDPWTVPISDDLQHPVMD